MVLSATIDPKRVIFEAQCFAIYDISDLLPRHPRFPKGTSKLDPNTNKPYLIMGYKDVATRVLRHLIVHQTAGGYSAANKQVIYTGEFFVRDPEWRPNPRFNPKKPAGKKNLQYLWTAAGRGWPGYAYTWFAPFAPIVWTNADGRELYIIYQCNKLSMVTFHTGSGMNDEGCGLAFQGYFLEPRAGVTEPMKGYDGQPSEAQLEILGEFWLGYAVPVLGISHLTGHWEHGKPSCPGQTLRERVIALRGGK